MPHQGLLSHKSTRARLKHGHCMTCEQFGSHACARVRCTAKHWQDAIKPHKPCVAAGNRKTLIVWWCRVLAFCDLARVSFTSTVLALRMNTLYGRVNVLLVNFIMMAGLMAILTACTGAHCCRDACSRPLGASILSQSKHFLYRLPREDTFSKTRSVGCALEAAENQSTRS